MTALFILSIVVGLYFSARIVRKHFLDVRMHRFVATKVMPPDFDDERANKA